ncbi:unnamed protein product, partial [Amoebophrya sp. A120]|eukprot:GSA120T00002620001.1
MGPHFDIFFQRVVVGYSPLIVCLFGAICVYTRYLARPTGGPYPAPHNGGAVLTRAALDARLEDEAASSLQDAIASYADILVPKSSLVSALQMLFLFPPGVSIYPSGFGGGPAKGSVVDFDETSALLRLERILKQCDGGPGGAGTPTAPTVLPYSRAVGSWGNEICARDAILDEIRQISSDLEVEVSANDTGAFHVDFIGGLINAYENLTNVAVRVSSRRRNKIILAQEQEKKGEPAQKDLYSATSFDDVEKDRKGPETTSGDERKNKVRAGGNLSTAEKNAKKVASSSAGVLSHCAPPYAILLGSHFDSAPGSPGASDALALVALLLEILRVITQFDVPANLLRNVDAIFLFNGAEEVILSGAHSFVRNHRWGRHICGFIN